MKVFLLDPPHIIHPPLRLWGANPGLLALAAVLRDRHDVRFVDATALPRTWYDLERILREEQPDVVGITANITSLAPDAVDAARLVREVSPRSTIIGGGSHLTLDAERLIDRPHRGLFDYLVLGEGERTIVELLDALENHEPVDRIPGLGICEDGRLRRTPPRPHIEDLDTLPLPAFDLIDFRAPAYKLTSVRDHIHVNTSRGCGDTCAFCSESAFWNARWRGISAPRIMEYIGTACEMHGTRVVDLADDSFNWDRERTEEFCDLLERSDLDIDFWFEARVDHILRDADLVPRLKKLGCFQIMLGVESISPRVLGNYQKGFNLNRSEEAIRLLHDNGIMAMTNIMLGDWHDDAETLEATYRFVRKVSDFLIVTITTPFPGTPYYDRMEAAGRIEERDLSKYDFLHPIMPTERLTRNEVLQLQYNLLRKFYTQPRILWEGLTDPNPYKRKFFKFVLRHVAREITRRPWRQPHYVTFEDFQANRQNRPA